MNTVQLRYSKRIVPVQYEHEELEITFGVDCDANLVARTEEMKAFVHNTLYGKTTSTITSTNSLKGETNGNSQESVKESSKKTSGKKSSTKSSQEEVKTSEATTEEMEEVESPFKGQAPSEPSKEEVKTEAKTTAKAADKAAKGVILYDRENADHRSTMTNFLTKLTGGKEWAKDKERSKKASTELSGQPFMDKAGEILPSFKELCKEKFGVESDAL